MSSKYTITIPKPCHEDIAKMKRTREGRFCDTCAKNVIDFSRRSKEDIAQYAKQNEGKELCGIFLSHQVETGTAARTARSLFTLRFFGMAIVFFFYSGFISCKISVRTAGPILAKRKDNSTGPREDDEKAGRHLAEMREECITAGSNLGPVVIRLLDVPGKLITSKDSVKALKEEKGIRAMLHYPTAQYALDKQMEDTLAKVLEELKRTPFATVYITGHTDNAGSSKANSKLSYRRAENVKKFFEKNEVPHRIVIGFFGEDMPVADNSTPEGRAKNRRVEIIVDLDPTGK
jgi:outer membrane protein OmpA-like peptidoglycan-associated protein